MAKGSADKKGAGATPEEGLSRHQKIMLLSAAAFVPFFLFILLPLLTRNHLITTLKLPPEVLLASPLTLRMAPSGDPTPTMRLTLDGVTIQIPRAFTPVIIQPRMVTFRNNPRRISRTISMSVASHVPRLDLKNSGAISLFVPDDMRDFLEVILWATWHPIRLYCKAQFFVTQGIAGSFFRTDWDAHHTGFVFPTPGNTGYLARIFAADRSRYIEFAMFDETDPVKLDRWTDVAITLQPPPPAGAAATAAPPSGPPLSLATNIGLATNEEAAPTVLQDCLNEYFRTGSASWLLPVGLVMEDRGFYRDTIALCKQALPRMQERPQELALWSDLFERSVKKILKIEVDPHLELDQVNVYIRNLSKFPVRRIRLSITCADATGERQFTTTVQESGWMQAEDEKIYHVATRPGFLSRRIQGMSWKVEDLEIGE
ncbi:MAG: hypothetical protein OZSIB_0837 [Candidatus Ozemobacter sibiricus]|uniref:Uncharacterized protein n=1 Tax=Candidatus Ozemobacter sibiricus TaxID=2268124 RepID=A0A367ZU83_9BACT|nr:MAG: hypothetical protein OZSIB_0837 [Candidatus Ozemobacter sibiricus]